MTVDIAGLRAFIAATTDGPWETGVTYITGAVAKPGELFAEPGRCDYCQYGDPTWTGRTDINGTVREAHEHRISFDDYGDPSVYGGPDGQPKVVVISGSDDFGPNLSPEDAAFIVAAREALPAALDEIERLHDALRVCEYVLHRAQPTDAQIHAAQQASGAYETDWTREQLADDIDPADVFGREEGDWG